MGKKLMYTFNDGSTESYNEVEMRVIRVIEEAYETTSLPPYANIKLYYDYGVFNNNVPTKALEAHLPYLLKDEGDDRTVLQRYEDYHEYGRRAFLVMNNLYREFKEELDYKPTGLSLHDSFELMDDKEYIEARSKLGRRGASPFQTIDTVYKELEKAVKRRPKSSKDTIAITFLGGIASKGQFEQMYGPIGFNTSIDSEIASKPILTSYTEGVTETTALIQCSKTATIASYFAGNPIADAEYFSRRIQASMHTLNFVSMQDCGTEMGMIISYLGDSGLDGMYYKLETSPGEYPGEWIKKDIFTPKDKIPNLGDKIMVRNINHCLNDRGDTVCIKCAGDMAYHKQPNHKYGMWLMTKGTEKPVQFTLSVKHYFANAAMTALYLLNDSVSYTMSLNNLYVNEGVDRVYIPLGKKENPQFKTYGLIDTVDINKLNLEQVSFISMLKERDAGNGKRLKIITLSSPGFLSREFLQHIKDNYHDTYVDNGNIVVDVSTYDKSKAIVNTVMKSVNFASLASNFRSAVSSGVGHTPEQLFDNVRKAAGTKLIANYSIYFAIIYVLFHSSKYDSRGVRYQDAPDGKLTRLDEHLATGNTFDRMIIGSDVTPRYGHRAYASDPTTNSLLFVSSYEDKMRLIDTGNLLD